MHDERERFPIRYAGFAPFHVARERLAGLLPAPLERTILLNTTVLARDAARASA